MKAMGRGGGGGGRPDPEDLPARKQKDQDRIWTERSKANVFGSQHRPVSWRGSWASLIPTALCRQPGQQVLVSAWSAAVGPSPQKNLSTPWGPLRK